MLDVMVTGMKDVDISMHDKMWDMCETRMYEDMYEYMQVWWLTW